MPKRFGNDTPELELADQYLQKIDAGLKDSVRKRTPVTAGPGNGQGRKSKWQHSPTEAIRVPIGVVDHLLAVAKEWDSQGDADRASNLYKNGSVPPQIGAFATINRPALRYYGSKWRLGNWIIQYLPPHTCYCEPYGGAAGVLLQKELSQYEVY